MEDSDWYSTAIECLIKAERGINPVKNFLCVIQKSDEILAKYAPTSDEYKKALSIKAEALGWLAEYGYSPEKTLEHAIKTCDEALKVITPTEEELYSNILLIKANVLVRLSEHSNNAVKNLKEAIETCNKIIKEVSTSLPEYYLALGTKGNAHLFLARLSIDPKQNLDSAINSYTEALIGLQQLKVAPYGFVQIFMNRAVAYSILALFAQDKCRDYLEKSLKDYNDVINILSKNELSQSQSYNKILVNKAMVMLRLADCIQQQSQKEVLFEALELCKSALKNLLPTSQNYGRALSCEADILFRLGEISEAEKAYIGAIKVFKETENWFGIIGAESGLGNLYYHAKEYKQAFENYKKAIDLVENIRSHMLSYENRKKFHEMYIEIYRKMVSTCIKLKEYEKAFEYAERSKSRVFAEMLSEKMPNNDVLKNTIISPDVLEDFLESILYYFIADNEEIIGFLIEKGELKTVKSLGSVREIIKYVETILKISKNPSELSENSTEMLHAIYQKLISPFESNLKKDLIIIPHRELHYVPFAALWDKRRGKYLIETHNIKLVPSATSLKLLKYREYPNKKALIIGNPTSDLPGAEEEAKFVKKVLKEKKAYDEIALLLRRDATGTALKNEISNSNLIHYSGHAFFDWNRPEESGLILHDGIFTVKDFAELQIPANLVVLSACETGLAKISPGDELEGLVRVIQLAGARYVIATLWPVNDYIAKRIFEIFYSEEGSVPEKLKKSQEKILKKWNNFLYWAPFQLYGG